MDEVDIASHISARQLKNAIAAARIPTVCSGRTRCLDCEAPIPAKRRRMVPGCERCVGCQTEFEEQNK